MNKSKALRVTLCTLTLIALFMLALLATIIFIGSNVAYAADGYIIGATSAALTTAQIAGIAVGGVVAGALTCFAVVSIIAEIRQKRKEEKIKKAEEAKKAAQKKQPVKKEQPKKQEQPKKENSAKIEEEKRKIDEEEAAKKAEEERIAAEKAAEERKIAEEATKKAQEEAEAQKAAEEAKRIEEERIAAERKAEEEKRKLIEEEAANKTEIVQDASMEDEEEDDEGIIEKTDESGRVFFIRYNKSFTAKLTQASDEVQGYYETLKNAILSYKKTTSRVSWFYDSVNSGRQNLLKFNIRGKTLVVYFAFDPAKFDDTKYNVEAVTSKKYETVPCLYRINGPLKCKFALELIDLLAQEYGLTKGEEQNENYHLKYKTTELLLSEGLIK